jgi:CubicO group peptidase (beta-lactamase class C family)
MDYFDYVRQRVLEPAGMRETGFFATEDAVPDRALRYTYYPTLRSPFVAGPRVESTARLDVRGGPAGGAYSTVGDLARFADALESGRLVRRETLARMLEGRPDYPYGYGFELDGRPVRSYGHGGSAPGATANLRVVPASGYTVAVLSNYDTAANLVGTYIRELIGR